MNEPEAGTPGRPERRREARFRPPPSLRLTVRAPGLRAWFDRSERALVDCSQLGIAWIDPEPPEIGEVVICDLKGGGWSLRGIPCYVRVVDRLVRDFRVGVEFRRELLPARRARKLAMALADLDTGTLGG